MKMFKWSTRAALLGALIANGSQQASAGERWRLFKHRASNVDTTCQSEDCAATVPLATRASIPAEAASTPPATPASTPPETVSAAVPSAPAPVMFAAPAAGGTIFGEQNSVGIKGFGLTMPQMHLELPTFHLPSVVRSRRNPEMQVDAARAPMVTGAPAAYGHIANAGLVSGQQQFASASVPSGPASTPARPASTPSSTTASPATTFTPAENCVPPYDPTCVPSVGSVQASPTEVVEMRRTLMSYQQELQRLSRALETASANAAEQSSQDDVPPAPSDSPIRRLSYTLPRKEKTAVRKQPQRVVESDAEEVYEQDELQQVRPRARRSTTDNFVSKAATRVTGRNQNSNE